MSTIEIKKQRVRSLLEDEWLQSNRSDLVTKYTKKLNNPLTEQQLAGIEATINGVIHGRPTQKVTIPQQQETKQPQKTTKLDVEQVLRTPTPSRNVVLSSELRSSSQVDKMSSPTPSQEPSVPQGRPTTPLERSQSMPVSRMPDGPSSGTAAAAAVQPTGTGVAPTQPTGTAAASAAQSTGTSAPPVQSTGTSATESSKTKQGKGQKTVVTINIQGSPGQQVGQSQPTSTSTSIGTAAPKGDIKTPDAKKPEPVKSLPPLSVKPSKTPIAPAGATGLQKFKGAVGAVVQQNRERGDRVANAAVALTSKSPSPNPSPAPAGSDPTAMAAVGMAYGSPLAGMLGPANAGALLQAQGDFKQMLDARTLPITLMLPLLVSLISVILGFVISVYYVILLIVMVIQQAAINAPLNIETVDYASIQSLTFFTPGQFNYTYFLLLPLVAIGGIGVFTALATVTNPTKPIPREIKGLVFVIGLSAVIMFFLQYLIYQKIGKTISAVDKRLQFFNKYICTKIYKNSLFLKELEIPQASIVGVHNTMQNCLKMIGPNTSVEEMAKAFFTLSMFYHYQKISLRNPIIFDAFNLFNTRSLLSRGCQPGAYLSRYGTYIEDISETLLRPQLSREVLQTKSDNVNKAFVLCNEWITNGNGYANTIYPEDSFTSFVIMAILTILIQMVPLYFIIKFYQQGQDMTSRILRALMENLGVMATKAEQQTIRM